MTGRRAYLMIEVAFSLGMLAVVLAAASVAISRGYQHQNGLWEEFVAEELAGSALERALADPHPAVFGAQNVTPADTPALLPGLSVTLETLAVSEHPELAALRVTVRWKRGSGPLVGQPQELRRETRRRIVR